MGAMAGVGEGAEARARGRLGLLLMQERCAPTVLRLALHDALTFDATTRIGGPNGSIRMEREQGHAGNEGLQAMVDRLEGLRKDLGGEMSFADLLHLGAAVAAEMIGGGRVAFRSGRKDKRACPPRGRLPDSDSPGSLEAVGRRAGLSIRQTVALAGYHPFAGAWGQAEAFEKEWKSAPSCMGNTVYKEILKGGDGLPTALSSLAQDPALKGLVEEFALDEGAWLRSYGEALSAASELGLAPEEKSASGAAFGDQLCELLDWAVPSEFSQKIAATGAVGGLVAISLYALRRRRATRLG